MSDVSGRLFEEPILKAKSVYEKTLEPLDRDDYLDAAEKGWYAVELMRKALLVAVGIPPEKAGRLEFSMPIFTRLLKVLERRELLRDYFRFDSCLHMRGFYEMLSTEDGIRETFRDVGAWLEEMSKLAREMSEIDLSDVMEIIDRALQVKRRLLQMSAEYHSLLERAHHAIEQAVATSRIRRKTKRD